MSLAVSTLARAGTAATVTAQASWTARPPHATMHLAAAQLDPVASRLSMESGAAGEGMAAAARRVAGEPASGPAHATVRLPAMAATTVKVRVHKAKAATHNRAVLGMQGRAVHVAWRHTSAILVAS